MSEVAFPTIGRIAGIDYGHVRIGVAVSDPDRRFASPWETYSRSDAAADADYFRRLASEERIVGFVVGLPVHLSGDESQKSYEARKFGAWLNQTTGLPVCFHDERYSTAEANELMAEAGTKRNQLKQRRDKLAAQLILTSFLAVNKPIKPTSMD
jgi:putative Holliday junction resolvase